MIPARELAVLAGQTYLAKLHSIYRGNLIWLPALIDTSGTVCTDYSGNNRPGTYNGGITLAGGSGPDGKPCPLFDGLNDNITPTVATLAALNTVGVFNPLEGTIGIWFKFNDVAKWNDANQYNFFKVGVADTDSMWLYKSAANTIRFRLGIGGVPIAATLGGQSALTWQHMLLTWSQSLNLTKGYLNGTTLVLDNVYAGVWAGALNANYTQVGSSNSGNYFPGNLIYPFLTNIYSTAAKAVAVARCP